ncbi:hypothetical protein [Comamonas sp. lk]|uniref:hypothetical protein n=1 Tax=Comamonas sp. lk TaxID=2201272 RepID=UPI001968D0D2|nr:hypothetical protein [Comamonas sp. lk]
MAELLSCTWAGGPAQIAKATVEREAREAYAAGLSPNEGCPYPFHSACGLHWLAHYNLAMPLPARSTPGSPDEQRANRHGLARMAAALN